MPVEIFRLYNRLSTFLLLNVVREFEGAASFALFVCSEFKRALATRLAVQPGDELHSADLL